jgi:hypothetical protein
MANPYDEIVARNKQLSISRYPFDSPKVNVGQARADRGARTEIRRGESRLQHRGDLDLLETELDRGRPGPFETATSTIFDFLNRPASAVSGAALELQRSGDLGAAIEEGGRQFIKSDERRFKDTPTFSQVLAGGQDEEATAAQAAAGFVLDMVTDPLNLVGGFIGKAGLRGLSQVGALAGKTRLGKAAGRAVVPDFELRGLARRGDAFNRDVGEGAFNTEALDKFIAERTGIRNLADAETREFAEAIAELEKGLSGDQLHALGLLSDSPSALRAAIEHRLQGLRPEDKELILQKSEAFLKFFRKQGEGDVAEGLLHNYLLRSLYVPIRSKAGEVVQPQIARNLSPRDLTRGAQPFQKKRKFDTVEEAYEHATMDVETDIARLAKIRSLESVRARSTKRLKDVVFDPENGISFKVEDAGLLKSIKEWKAGIGNATPEMKAMLDKGYDFTEIVKGDGVFFALPKPIADDLAAANRLWTNSEELNSMFEGFRKWQSVWKGMAVFSPGFHARNMYGNWFNNWLAGVNDPRDYAEAFAQQTAKSGKYYDLALKNGILQGGQITAELGEFAGIEKIPSLAGKIINSRPMRANRAAGAFIENNAKLAHFINKMKKGMSEEEARASVNKYLFDYTALTPFERDVMRTIIPFYSWMRFNIPLQVEAMIANPQKYGRIAKLINNLEQMSADQRDLTTPDYFEELHAIRTPKAIGEGFAHLNGQPVQPTFFNPNLPFQDLNRFNIRDIASSISPLPKLFFESIPKRGYSVFLDRPLEKFEGEPDEVTGLRRKFQNAMDTALPTVGKARRLARESERGFLWQQLFTELGGLKFMGVDEGRVQRGSLYDRRNAVRRALDASDRRQ